MIVEIYSISTNMWYTCLVIPIYLVATLNCSYYISVRKLCAQRHGLHRATTLYWKVIHSYIFECIIEIVLHMSIFLNISFKCVSGAVHIRSYVFNRGFHQCGVTTTRGLLTPIVRYYVQGWPSPSPYVMAYVPQIQLSPHTTWMMPPIIYFPHFYH